VQLYVALWVVFSGQTGMEDPKEDLLVVHCFCVCSSSALSGDLGVSRFVEHGFLSCLYFVLSLFCLIFILSYWFFLSVFIYLFTIKSYTEYHKHKRKESKKKTNTKKYRSSSLKK